MDQNSGRLIPYYLVFQYITNRIFYPRPPTIQSHPRANQGITDNPQMNPMIQWAILIASVVIALIYYFQIKKHGGPKTKMKMSPNVAEEMAKKIVQDAQLHRRGKTKDKN